MINDAEKKMLGAIDFLKHEFSGLRTGRAHPALVEGVLVEAYGTHMRLSDLASISVPEARQLLISPFDANNTAIIAKGIIAANLNLQPQVEGSLIRIRIPELDASFRQEMIKQVRKKAEETKIAIRNIRREANEKTKKQKSEGGITEDILKSTEKKVQDLTDKYCKVIDELTKEKEKEITAI